MRGTESIRTIARVVVTPEFADNVDPTRVSAVLERFRDVTKQIAEFEKMILEAVNKQEQLISTSTLLRSELQARSTRIDELNSELDVIRKKPIYDYKAVILSFRQTLFGLFYFLVGVPTIILTLVVTIASGGLGSVVSFTRSMVSDGGGSSHLQKLFVAVSEGIAAAIAIFFLANTGLLMLTNGGSEHAASADISPYMVAFLAFVSGFMAEDAFKSIQRAGRSMFQERTPT